MRSSVLGNVYARFCSARPTHPAVAATALLSSLLGSLVAAAAPATRPTTLPAAFDRRAVCKAEALFAAKGKAGEASAVAVFADIGKVGLLTVRHAVEGADVVTVTLPDGRQAAAKVTLIDDQPRLRDIAMLVVEADQVPLAVLGTLPAVSDRVWAVGRHAQGKAPGKATEVANAEGGGRS